MCVCVCLHRLYAVSDIKTLADIIWAITIVTRERVKKKVRKKRRGSDKKSEREREGIETGTIIIIIKQTETN